MRIETQCDGMAPGRVLQEYIERRIESGFGIYRDRIEVVRVRLIKVNEPRDGRDKSCQVQGFLSSGEKVLVEVMDSDLHVAIHQAVDRASWTVARRLQREQRLASDMLFDRRNLHGQPEPVRVA